MVQLGVRARHRERRVHNAQCSRERRRVGFCGSGPTSNYPSAVKIEVKSSLCPAQWQGLDVRKAPDAL